MILSVMTIGCNQCETGSATFKTCRSLCSNVVNGCMKPLLPLLVCVLWVSSLLSVLFVHITVPCWYTAGQWYGFIFFLYCYYGSHFRKLTRKITWKLIKKTLLIRAFLDDITFLVTGITNQHSSIFIAEESTNPVFRIIDLKCHAIKFCRVYPLFL